MRILIALVMSGRVPGYPMSSGSTGDGTTHDEAQFRRWVNYAIDQLERRVLQHLNLAGSNAKPLSQEEYVTTAEMARTAGMSQRQFKRAFTEGPHKDALRALALKRGVKTWRWPVKRTLALLQE